MQHARYASRYTRLSSSPTIRFRRLYRELRDIELRFYDRESTTAADEMEAAQRLQRAGLFMIVVRLLIGID